MNTSNARTAWIVAGILAVLLIIMTVMWARETGALGGAGLGDARDRIQSACRTADDLDSAECRDALNDLGRLLDRFNDRIRDRAEEMQDAAEGADDAATTTGQ